MGQIGQIGPRQIIGATAGMPLTNRESSASLQRRLEVHAKLRLLRALRPFKSRYDAPHDDTESTGSPSDD